MLYSELRAISRKTWNEKSSYLCIDMTRNKSEGKYRIINDSKNIFIECILENEAF